MNGDASSARQVSQATDWLEQAPDLPHLIARVSELVLRLGHEPGDLVVLPRAELDRRELSAYSAGWADVVDEQLPAVRRAYEQRISAAYLQGQQDARTGSRPRRTRRPEGEGAGGEVVPLPYVRLQRPPPELTRVEQRGERERSVADGAVPPPPPSRGAGGASEAGGAGDDAGGAEAGSTGTGTVPSARQPGGKRPVRSRRRAVIRRNGRPSVPPLARSGVPVSGRDKGPRTGPDPTGPAGEPLGPARDAADAADPVRPPGSAGRVEDRPRLSDRARALADELEGRADGRRREEPGAVPGPGGGRRDDPVEDGIGGSGRPPS